MTLVGRTKKLIACAFWIDSVDIREGFTGAPTVADSQPGSMYTAETYAGITCIAKCSPDQCFNVLEIDSQSGMLPQRVSVTRLVRLSEQRR